MSASSSPAISKNWRVVSYHASCYTDGNAKVDRAFKQQQLHKSTAAVDSTLQPIAACYNNGDVTLLDLSSGHLVHTIHADLEDEFTTFSLSPDHTSLLTYSRKATQLTLWSCITYKAILSWKALPPHTQAISELAFDPSGRYAASASLDKTIRVWDTTTGRATHQFKGHQHRITRLSWHPRVKRMEVISTDDGGYIHRCQLLTNQLSVCSKEHLSDITALAWSPDGQRLITSGKDKVVCIWDASADYKHLLTIPVYEVIEAVLVWPPAAPLPLHAKAAKQTNTTVILAAGEGGGLKLWNSANGKCLFTHKLPSILNTSNTQQTDNSTNTDNYIANQVSHLFVLPLLNSTSPPTPTPSFHLVVVTKEQNFLTYDPYSFVRRSLHVGHNDEIIDVKLHPDQQRMVVATNSAQVRIFDIRTFAADLLSGHSDTVLSVDVSTDGRWVVTSSKDLTVRVWDLLDAARCVSICEGHTETVGCVSFSKLAQPTAKLFIVSGARDKTVKLWDATALRHLAVPETNADSNDHDSTSSSSLIPLPCLFTRVAHDKDVNCVCISSNDQFLASGGEDKSIHIFSLLSSSSMKTLATLKGHRRGVWCLRFSPIDQVLASGSGDKTVKLWSLTDWTCLKTFEGHTGSIKSLVFLNAGMQIMSAGDDSTIRIWLIKTNECINTLSPPNHDHPTTSPPSSTGATAAVLEPDDDEDSIPEKIWALDISRDESFMVSGGTASTLNIWRDVTAQDEAEQRVEKQQLVLKEQTLMNLIRQKQFSQAIHLALQLKQPRRMYGVLLELISRHSGGSSTGTSTASNSSANTSDHDAVEQGDAMSAVSSLDELLSSIWLHLSADEVNTLLIYVRDWNTNAKTARVANQLLAAFFQSFAPDTIQHNKILAEAIPGMILYCDRHFQRIDRLLQKSFLLDHMLDAMKLLSADEGEDEANEEIGTEELSLAALIDRSAQQHHLVQSHLTSVLPAVTSNKNATVSAPSSRILSLPHLAMFDEEKDELKMDAADDEAAWASNWTDDHNIDHNKIAETHADGETEASSVIRTRKQAQQREPVQRRRTRAASAVVTASDEPEPIKKHRVQRKRSVAAH